MHRLIRACAVRKLHKGPFRALRIKYLHIIYSGIVLNFKVCMYLQPCCHGLSMHACSHNLSPSASLSTLYTAEGMLTLVMLNKLNCHAHFQFSANQITWSKLLIQIHLLNGKQCRSRSVGFFRSQMIWIYTVCKGRVYLGSAGQGLRMCYLYWPEWGKTYYLPLNVKSNTQWTTQSSTLTS